VGGLAWASSKGAVACAYLPKNVFEPGVGVTWKQGQVGLPASYEFFLGAAGDGCKPSRFWVTNVQTARARAARAALLRAPVPTGAGAPLAFTVKRGEGTANVHLDGAGGAPAVQVAGPDGEVLESAPNDIRVGTHLRVLAHEEVDTTWIGVDDAKPGTYTVTPMPGSAPITGMSETRPEPGERLKASVTGKGDTRVLHYDVGSAPGQLVRFYERGAATWQELGNARTGKGTIRFTPASGPGGKREIVAAIEVDDLPGPDVTVATFKAPAPPKAGAVKRVRARRQGKKLAVIWRPAENADRYRVVATLRDGVQRAIEVSGRRSKARIGRLSATQPGRVMVSALGPLGDWGKPGKARFKATRREPDDRLLEFR
jgi:hypothetical protein